MQKRTSDRINIWIEEQRENKHGSLNRHDVEVRLIDGDPELIS